MAPLAPSSPIVLPLRLPIQAPFSRFHLQRRSLQTSLPRQTEGCPSPPPERPGLSGASRCHFSSRQYTKAFGSIPNQSASNPILISGRVASRWGAALDPEEEIARREGPDRPLLDEISGLAEKRFCVGVGPSPQRCGSVGARSAKSARPHGYA